MSPLTEYIQILSEGKNLTSQQAESAARYLSEGQPVEQATAFLSALNQKGESVEEVTAFATVFRKLAINPGFEDLIENAVDVVGTGGSKTNGYNISSATALILASGGATVLKHGNRAITSKSGAADFLSELGIIIQSDPANLRRSIEELNFCFFFAPAFHPAFKEIVPVRKALAEAGQRSIFNILGPLINPAKPKQQLLGVHHEQWVTPLAQVLTSLGVRRGLTVCGLLDDSRRIDEITTASPTRVCGMGELNHINTTWTPEDFEFEIAPWSDIEGGDATVNVALFEDILNGKGRQGLRDTLILNAACGFFIVGKCDSIKSGCDYAKELLQSGQTANFINRARTFYQSLSQ